MTYTIIVVIISFLIGVLSATLMQDATKGERFDGYFRINHKDPTKDLVRLELETDLDEIEEQGYLLLEVKSDGE